MFFMMQKLGTVLGKLLLIHHKDVRGYHIKKNLSLRNGGKDLNC